MKNKGKYYLTTAIAYTSGKPHIGNTYEIILSDAIARYRRSQGYDVFFQTGTDEHGQKIEEKAVAAGVTPQAYVDGVADVIRENYKLMNISYDYFVRTTDDYHVKQVQKIFKKLYEQGDIYKVNMKACIVRHVSPSGLKASLSMGNVLTAAGQFRKQLRKRISSICRNMLSA